MRKPHVRASSRPADLAKLLRSPVSCGVMLRLRALKPFPQMQGNPYIVYDRKATQPLVNDAWSRIRTAADLKRSANSSITTTVDTWFVADGPRFTRSVRCSITRI